MVPVIEIRRPSKHNDHHSRSHSRHDIGDRSSTSRHERK